MVGQNMDQYLFVRRTRQQQVQIVKLFYLPISSKIVKFVGRVFSFLYFFFMDALLIFNCLILIFPRSIDCIIVIKFNTMQWLEIKYVQNQKHHKPSMRTKCDVQYSRENRSLYFTVNCTSLYFTVNCTSMYFTVNKNKNVKNRI